MVTQIYKRWSTGSEHLRNIAELAKRAGSTSDDTPHSMTPQQIERFAASVEEKHPGLAEYARNAAASSGPGVLNSVLPNTEWGPRRGQVISSPPGFGGFGSGFGGSNGGQHFFTSRVPYTPETSQDRQDAPVHRRLANVYNRLFNRTDPLVGSVLEMLSSLPWSEFQLTGEGVDGSIKETMEYSLRECKMLQKLAAITSEYFVVGEAIPHLTYSDTKGAWTHLSLHNPDHVNVVHSPFIKMDPILEFVPDAKLKEVANSNHPMLARLRESMPPELVNALRVGKNIPLSPVNASLVARKMHDYDIRGTAIMTRLWRTFMLEDAYANASISTARRTACFVAGTPVMTASGVKAIEDIQDGEKIIAGNGKLETVESAWAAGTSEEGLVTIKAQGSLPLYCTPNHRFLAWVAPRSCACGCGTPLNSVSAKRKAFALGHHLNLLRDKKTGRMTSGAEAFKVYSKLPNIRAPKDYDPTQKIEAKDLRAGDFLLIPRKFDVVKTDITPEQARILGYYIAEGTNRDVTYGRGEERYLSCEGVAFTFSLEESETWAPDVVACAQTLGVDARIYRYVPGPETKMAQSGRVGRTTVYISRQKDEHFSRWLKRHGGVGANSHVLSEEVMRWPLELKKELIRGYYRGDGYCDLTTGKRRGPQVVAVTTSSVLSYQLRLILAQLGIFAGLYHNLAKELHWSDQWRLCSNGNHAIALSEMVWGETIEGGKCEWARTWVDDNYVYVPVTSVEARDDNVPVYNLTVSGDHSYLAEGLQTYNSPLRVLLLGDSQTGNVGTPAEEARLQSLLAQCETDPVGHWLVWNYQVKHEMWGAPERVIGLTQHYDLIEQLKLTALGVSKAFITGDSTYSCFVGETKVVMSDGSRKKIVDVKVGDIVPDHEGKPRIVEAAWPEEPPDELVDIHVWGHRKPITATKNHKWPVWAWARHCACGCGEPVKPGVVFKQKHYQQLGGRWHTAPKSIYVDGCRNLDSKPRRIAENYNPRTTLTSEELRKEDYLLVPRKFKAVEPKESTDFARLLGYWTAEGNFIKHKTKKTISGLRFTFNKNEKDSWVADVCDLLRSEGFSDPNDARVSEKKNTCTVNSQDQTLIDKHARVLELAGQYAHGKEFSSEVMSWPLSHKTELIRGLLRGDGSQTFRQKTYNRRDQQNKARTSNLFYVAYTTVSEKLSNQVQTILSQLGFFATQYRQETKNSRRPRYILFVYGLQARDLSRLVWQERSKADLVEDAMVYAGRRSYKVDEDYIYVPIRKVVVRDNSEKVPVYNLTISGPHTYQIEGGLSTHNSAAAGLTLFLQRLKALRDFFVNEWLIPKFFLPMSVMNGWTKKETKTRQTTKTGSVALDDMDRYIIPTIEWSKALDPNIDKERMDAYTALEQGLGARISPQRKYAALGLDFEEEAKQLVEDTKFLQDLAGEDPLLQGVLGLAQPVEDGPGGGGGGAPLISPAIPGDAFGMGDPDGGGDMGGGAPGGDMAAPPGGGEAPGPAPAAVAAPGTQAVSTTPATQRSPESTRLWAAPLLKPIKQLFDTFNTDSIADTEPWADALKDQDVKVAIETGDRGLLWETLEAWMLKEGYPNAQIQDLQGVLVGQPGATKLAAHKNGTEHRFILQDSGSSDYFIKGS